MNEHDRYSASDLAICPACGNAIDHCPGHGDIGDPTGAAIVRGHDTDEDHSQCHPEGCTYAAEREGSH